MEGGSVAQGSRVSSLAIHGVVAAAIVVAALITQLQYEGMSASC